MRVVHLTTIHLPLDVRIFWKECRTLASAGHQVHLVTFDPPVDRMDGVYLHALPKPRGRTPVGRFISRLQAAYRVTVGLSPDTVHFHDPELIPVALLLKTRGIRVIYDVHEDSPREALSLARNRGAFWRGWARGALWGILDELARRECDLFVCAVPAILTRFPASRSVLVRNFPLRDEFATAGSADQPAKHGNRIAYVGGLTETRGIRDMVRAMELLPDDLAAELHLAGLFSPADLREELAALPGWTRIRDRGWLGRPDVVQLLTESRLGLLVLHPRPDYLDALPVKLFEYMAAGIPVIVSDFPLWREIVEGAECGLLVDPQDPPAIARAMARLLEDPDQAREMGSRGREAVRRHYDWSAEGTRLVELYNRLDVSAPGRKAGWA